VKKWNLRGWGRSTKEGGGGVAVLKGESWLGGLRGGGIWKGVSGGTRVKLSWLGQLRAFPHLWSCAGKGRFEESPLGGVAVVGIPDKQPTGVGKGTGGTLSGRGVGKVTPAQRVLGNKEGA